MTFFHRTLAAGALFALACASAPGRAADKPVVSEAWARPTVEGQQGGGGFLTITGGARGDRLLGATAEVAKTVELHTMKMDGDVMRMRRVDAIDVPAGATVKLDPGGLHLMFIGLKAPLANGSSFPPKLRFDKAGEVTVPVQVKPRP